MKKVSFILILFVTLNGHLLAGVTGPVTTGFIPVTDGNLYYEMAGQGEETIVLVHDGMVHHVIYDAQFPVFAERYRVIRYDRRGYGQSPRPEKPFSNAEDLNAVIDTLKIDKAILIGMSAGGGLVIDYTIKYPEKVSAIVLVGAVVGGFSYSDHLLTRGGRLTAEDYADRDKLLEYLVKKDPYEIAPANQEKKEQLWLIMDQNRQNMDRAKNRLAEIPKLKAIDALNEIKVPALIMVGEYDIPDVFVHAGAIESGIKGSQKVIVRNAGHLVPFEQPVEFNRHVFDFLNSAEFFQILNTRSVDQAKVMFNERRIIDPDWIPFSENRMNIMGYEQLRSGNIAEAIGLFKLNVEAFPASANAYDSLGEAYMVNGDKELAIENYTKSLQLDPGNENAREMLKKLE